MYVCVCAFKLNCIKSNWTNVKTAWILQCDRVIAGKNLIVLSFFELKLLISKLDSGYALQHSRFSIENSNLIFSTHN